jgi:hypothetical protein
MHISPLFMCETSWPPDVYAVFGLCYPFVWWNKGKEELVKLNRAASRVQTETTRT